MALQAKLEADVVIVGGGHAGAQCAIALRQAKFVGTIAIVGDETEFPYERPPLSKEYLAKDKSFDRILLRPPAFWTDKGITMLLGYKVIAVAPGAHEITIEGGARIGYGILVWAARGMPRRLSCAGDHFNGIHMVRNREDVDRMEAELADVGQAVVIGGGYIGLEAAAVLSKLGKQVVLLEALDRVLARVSGEALSRFYEAEHRAHGVDVRLGAKVDGMVGEGDRVSGVQLVGGEMIPGQMVIVGIGIVPAVGPLLAAGAAGDNGVAVVSRCHTSLPDIYAIGDCALHANGFADGVDRRGKG